MNKNIKIVRGLVLMMAICSSAVSFAQQDPQFTQYMYNASMINPAYASSKDHMSIFGMYRTQWVGLDGAPKTANLSMTTPLGDKGLGMGVHLSNDRIGAMDENTIAVDLAYTINLNYDYKLAIGIKGTGDFLNVDYNRLDIYDPSDPNIQENINKFTPNVGAGIMLFSDKSYVGISVPSLLTNYRYNQDDIATMKQRMTLYLTGGYVFDLSDDVLFKPAAMVKATSGAPLQVDLSANFMFMKKLTVGAAYRWDASVSGLVGFQISDSMMVGYSYDADTTNLGKYNSGSHEIFLQFDLFSKIRRVNAPRFF